MGVERAAMGFEPLVSDQTETAAVIREAEL
jgi:hypothetical protein